jgi:hypothetical protein
VHCEQPVAFFEPNFVVTDVPSDIKCSDERAKCFSNHATNWGTHFTANVRSDIECAIKLSDWCTIGAAVMFPIKCPVVTAVRQSFGMPECDSIR